MPHASFFEGTMLCQKGVTLVINVFAETTFRLVVTMALSVFLQSHLSARETVEDSLEEEPRHHLGAEASFNAHDVFVGLTFHYAKPFGEGFSLISSIAIRPFGKEALVEDSPGIFLYLREERVFILLGIERQLFLTPQFSAFANVLGGMTFPNYRGTQRGHGEPLIPAVAAGMQWSIPSGKYFAGDAVALRLGEQYINIEANKFRFYFSILLAL